VSDGEHTAKPVDKRPDVREWVPVLAQLLGVVAIATGFGILALWAGLVAGGVLLVAGGTVAEMDRRRE
jgi:hypothetical protein